MVIGFIGTGVISEAMIHGLCNAASYVDPILISMRSADRSARLAVRYPNVEVIGTNQDLVNRSDWVFVGVLPSQMSEVLEPLEFRATQKIISLAAGVSLKSLHSLVAPCEQVTRAIPMPPIEFGSGPIALCPFDTEVEAFCNQIGVAVSVEDEQQFNLFGAASALMSDFFSQIATTSAWMSTHGLETQLAARYTTALYTALAAQTARESSEALPQMSESCETPGGLNQEFRRLREERGASQSLREGLDRILARLESAS